MLRVRLIAPFACSVLVLASATAQLRRVPVEQKVAPAGAPLEIAAQADVDVVLSRWRQQLARQEAVAARHGRDLPPRVARSRELLGRVERGELRLDDAVAELKGPARLVPERDAQLSAATFSGMTREEYELLAASGRAPGFLAALEDRLPSHVAAGASPRAEPMPGVPRRTVAPAPTGASATGPFARVNAGWIQQQRMADATMPPPLTVANHEAIPTVWNDSVDRLWVSFLWQRSASAISGGFFDAILVYQSGDFGETWQWNAAIWNTNSPIRSISWPHLAVDPSGNRVHVSYESEDWDTFGYVNEGIYSFYYDPYGGAPITMVNVWASLNYDSVYPIVATEFNQATNYVTVAFQDNDLTFGDSDVIAARSTDRGATYSSVWYVVVTSASEGLPWIASGASSLGASLMTIAYQTGAPADIRAVTASRGDPSIFNTATKNLVLSAAAFGGSHHDPCVAHAHGSGDVIVTAEVDIGAGHNLAFGFSTNDGVAWTQNYWFGPADIRRFPIIAVDGIGRTAVNTTWDNFHVAFFHSPTSTTRGNVRHFWADATTNPPSWYTLTANLDASDDPNVAAGSQCVSVTSYRIGLPGLAWHRWPTGSNLDVYFTTLGDNYQFDTKHAGTHIALTVDVDAATALPTIDYEAWPTSVAHTVQAVDAGDIGIYHYGFLDWTWSGGSQAPRLLPVTSDYYDGFPPAPVVAYDANYNRCWVQQPSIGNTLRAVKSGTMPDMSWTNPGGEREGYAVYRATVPGPKTNFSILGTTTGTSYLDGTASPGALYCFKVMSYCGTQPGHQHEGPWGNLLADFTSNAPVCNGTNAVNFVNTTNGGTPPYSYLWDFGDGFTSTAVNPSHTYTTPPFSRNVTLTVTDSDVPTPKTSMVSKSIGTGTAVGAAFTYTKVDLVAFFDGTPSGGTGSYSYVWRFGDGATSTLQDPSHAYAAPGTYNVSFQVTDAASGCQASVTQPIVVP